MILISRARRVSIGCFRYRSKSSSLLAFNSSRFLFSSIAVSDKSLTLCNQCKAFGSRDEDFVPGASLSSNSKGPVVSATAFVSGNFPCASPYLFQFSTGACKMARHSIVHRSPPPKESRHSRHQHARTGWSRGSTSNPGGSSTYQSSCAHDA
jgi:hypothetical protein